MGFKVLIALGVVVFLLLAGWLVMGRRKSIGSGRFAAIWDSELRDSLFVDTDPATRDLLLEDWRWKVGDDAKVFRVTVFGDLFTQTPDGRVYWLDTGTGRYVEAARSAEHWAETGKKHGRDWFHWKTLERLRSLGVQLTEGMVYSWRQSPGLGGTETPDNVDLLPLQVHVSDAGRVAEAVKDLPSGATLESVDFELLGPRPSQGAAASGDQDTALYEVVINSEEQYSMWPAGTDIPAGWKSAGKTGTKQECLDYITEVWTDFRPLSVRKKMEGR